jgi:hypothetical protein
LTASIPQRLAKQFQLFLLFVTFLPLLHDSKAVLLQTCCPPKQINCNHSLQRDYPFKILIYLTEIFKFKIKELQKWSFINKKF